MGENRYMDVRNQSFKPDVGGMEDYQNFANNIFSQEENPPSTDRIRSSPLRSLREAQILSTTPLIDLQKRLLAVVKDYFDHKK